MEASLQNILQQRFKTYARQHAQPLHKHKVAQAVMDCRTPVLGGHVQSCPQGHIDRIWYNSCKNRSCPKCSALPTERWLNTQKARLLDCDHYHVIFTLPHQLHAIWWTNNRLMTQMLFQTATSTLTELLQDAKYLGANPGILASFHTWGRTLSRHPHLHCLVTGGGLNHDGDWTPVNNGYLLPFRVVRALFRGRFIAALRRAFRKGTMTLPPELNEATFQGLLHRLAKKTKWNVYIQERYTHGHGVATYLARYVKGGPLRDQSILNMDENTVLFRYTDHRDQQTKTQAFKTHHFIQRWLWHLPESGQHRIRYYGLYHPRQKDLRAKCRSQIGQPPETKAAELDWQAYWIQCGQAQKSTCPICNEPLCPSSLIPRSYQPP